MPAAWSLASTVAEHAAVDPGAVAVVGESGNVTTYAELDAAASAQATLLRERCRHGQPVLVLQPPGAELLASILACWRAGLTPVPAPVPAGPRSHLARATEAAVESGAVVAVAERPNVRAVTEWAGHNGLDSLAIVPVGDLFDPGPLPDVAPPRVALACFSGGPAPRPRTLAIGQDALERCLGTMARAWGAALSGRVGGPLPPYSAVGLLTLLLAPLASGGTAVVVPAHADSRGWLTSVRRHRLTLTAAPAATYREAVMSVSLADPLDTLSAALYPADASDPEVMAAFGARYLPAGRGESALRPYYGFTGRTLMVASGTPANTVSVDADAWEHGLVREAGTASPSVDLVGVQVDRDSIRVVEPRTGSSCEDGRVGEIWVRANGSSGWCGRPEESNRLFGARTSGGEGPFVRTGDIGAVHGQSLLPAGKVDEVLHVHGRALPPRWVEESAARVHPALRRHRTVAFTVGARREQLVVVQEVPRDVENLPVLAHVVREELADRLGVVATNVVFVATGTVRLGIDGQVDRRTTRDLFTADAIRTLYEELDAEVRRRCRPGTGPV